MLSVLIAVAAFCTGIVIGLVIEMAAIDWAARHDRSNKNGE